MSDEFTLFSDAVKKFLETIAGIIGKKAGEGLSKGGRAAVRNFKKLLGLATASDEAFKEQYLEVTQQLTELTEVLEHRKRSEEDFVQLTSDRDRHKELYETLDKDYGRQSEENAKLHRSNEHYKKRIRELMSKIAGSEVRFLKDNTEIRIPKNPF